MDVDEILALERELTEQEFTFLEADTLKVMRTIRKRIDELMPRIAAHDRRLAERMDVSSNRMLWALEEGVRLPIHEKIEDTGALKDLTRQVRRLYVEIMGGQPTDPGAPVVSLPRRDRRRLGRRERKRGAWTGPRP